MNRLGAIRCLATFNACACAAIVCLEAWMASAASIEPGAVRLRAPWNENHRLDLEGRSFDVGTQEGLRDLVAWVDVCLERHAAIRREFKARREESRARSFIDQATPVELRELWQEPSADLSGRMMRGLKELRRLATDALDNPSARPGNVQWLFEINSALQNNRRPPAPSKMEIGQPPLVFLDYSYNPIACGHTPASNVPTNGVSDPSKCDPPDSSFWTRPKSISALDLYHGFNRTGIPALENVLWRYAAPKTSYGGCPGMDVTDGHRVLKVKFAETRSEPFAARIFWALGFNVDPTDHLQRLKVKYDRRLLREFHLRKPVQTGIYAFWLIRVHTIDLQKRYDPFDSIARAVLTDGTELSSSQLKRLLFVDSHRPHPEDDPKNFREEVELQIDYLETVPANVQYRDRSERSIGPWDFAGLGHENLREVRGVGLLGAWIGWFDSRFENTRLKIVRSGQRDDLRHFFSDLGGGLGKAVGPLSRCCESPNQFGWVFTHPRVLQGAGRMTIPFRITGYEPIEDTLAFERVTWDDARWMARWIGKLSEDQIRAALIAAGFDSAHVRIYTEKLISRRDRMLVDLELDSEVPLLRPGGAETKPSHQGGLDCPPISVLPDGRTVTPVSGDSVLKDGMVVLVPAGVTGDSPNANR
jgi:hypothetical protein